MMKVRGEIPKSIKKDNDLYIIKAILKWRAWNLLLGNKSIYDQLKIKSKKKPRKKSVKIIVKRKENQKKPAKGETIKVCENCCLVYIHQE